MSFGVSIGDFIAIGSLTWNLYRNCRSAPESFGNIHAELLSFHALVKEAEETIFARSIPTDRAQRLKVVTDGCNKVLGDLTVIVDKYKILASDTKGTWVRLKWHFHDINEIRQRLIASRGFLNGFIRWSGLKSSLDLFSDLGSISQVVVEQKLIDYREEFRRGNREQSVASVQTTESLTIHDKETWRAIRKELEEAGITVATFDANKDFILKWIVAAFEKGEFQESSQESSVAAIQESSIEKYHIAPNAEYQVAPGDDASLYAPPTPRKARVDPDSQHIQTAPGDDTSLYAPPPPGMTKVDPASQQTRWADYYGPEKDNKESTRSAPHRSSPGSTPRSNPGKAAKPKPGATKTKPGPSPSQKERISKLASLAAAISRPERSLRKALHLNDIAKAEAILKDPAMTKYINVDVVGSDDRTALPFACENAYVSLIRLLLAQPGIDINAYDYQTQKALPCALRGGNLEIVDILLSHPGIDVNAVDRDRVPPLISAINNGYSKVAESILALPDVDVNICDWRSQPALACAIEKGDTQVVKALLARSGVYANLHAVDHPTPLQIASEKDNIQIVNLLLGQADISVNSFTKDGETALAIATRNGGTQIVKSLLAHAAIKVSLQVDISQKYVNPTPLHLALRKDYIQIARLLLAHPTINVNAVTKDGETALAIATERGHTQIIKSLLAYRNINPNLQIDTILNPTPLHLASSKGYIQIVEQFLDRADIAINATDRQGRTALALTAGNGNTEAVELLLTQPQIRLNAGSRSPIREHPTVAI
jgi:ankyrin repeat protein